MRIADRVGRITLTGLDEWTDVAAVGELTKNERVEVAGLYSLQRAGQADHPRYPSYAFLKRLAEALRGKRTAVHLCGRDTLESFVSGERTIHQLVEKFGRVQLNGDLMKDRLGERLAATMQANYPDKPFITQHNPTNAALARKVESSEHQLLVDDSGGKGQLPAVRLTSVKIMCPNLTCRRVSTVPASTRGHTVKCTGCKILIRVPPPKSPPEPQQRWMAIETTKQVGYAGGLGPGVIAQELPMIARVVGPGAGGTWIDMESGLRDKKDLFCLEKAKAAVAEYERTSQLEIG